MSILVAYYSWSGKGRILAEKIAKEQNADLLEVLDEKRPSAAAAYTGGCFRAMRGMVSPIKPMEKNPAVYDTVIAVSPVWASNAAPAIYNVFDALKPGTKLELYLVSGSGSSNRQKITNRAEKGGGKVAAYHDIKCGTILD